MVCAKCMLAWAGSLRLFNIHFYDLLADAECERSRIITGTVQIPGHRLSPLPKELLSE